jgi:hypothetical protein
MFLVLFSTSVHSSLLSYVPHHLVMFLVLCSACAYSSLLCYVPCLVFNTCVFSLAVLCGLLCSLSCFQHVCIPPCCVMLLVFNTCIPPCCVMFHILFSTHLYSFLLCYVLCYVPCLVFNKCVFPLAVLCTPLCYVPCLVLEINACWHCGICRPVCSHLRTQGCKMDFHGMLC